ncbi:MAG: hypothetical protein J0I11_01160 [Actinobacteria bacterium]|nr:hypothetical protein [Actinomycetota bacterium]
MNTIARTAARSDPPPPMDIAEVVPQARRAHPVELAPGDLLFDTTGTLQQIESTSVFHDGKIVSALLANGHRAWFWNDDPIIAVLPRTEAPTITVYERVFDPEDEAGWAQGNPRVMDTETETHTWEPDDGNPISWAADILNRSGTLEPSSSPPFTQRTWYSGSGIDFARSGATVDTSAHLAGFTLAEAEQIGTRITTPPSPRLSPVLQRGLSRTTYDASRARSRVGLSSGR